MEGWLKALALSALPAAGNFLGGIASELFPVSQRGLSLALHAAAGVVFAVVGVELMPRALGAHAPWVVLVAFMAGGAFFLLVERLLDAASRRSGRANGSRAAWAIYFGVAVDLFSDGVMIGTGSTLSFGLGLLLALGQVPADLPEGFATIATYRKSGIGRRNRLLLSASFALPVFLGATLGYWLLQGRPEIVKLSVLAFTAGILLTVAVEEMVPEAHEGEEARFAAMALVLGFAVFAGLSAYLK